MELAGLENVKTVDIIGIICYKHRGLIKKKSRQNNTHSYEGVRFIPEIENPSTRLKAIERFVKDGNRGWFNIIGEPYDESHEAGFTLSGT
jgi:hypothetical protein